MDGSHVEMHKFILFSIYESVKILHIDRKADCGEMLGNAICKKANARLTA
jgi:hypothetical protein